MFVARLWFGWRLDVAIYLRSLVVFRVVFVAVGELQVFLLHTLFDMIQYPILLFLLPSDGPLPISTSHLSLLFHSLERVLR